MNSKPFFFDENIFDEDGVIQNKHDETPKPEFTKDELKSAQKKAYEEGKKDGLQESEQAKTQQLLEMVTSLNTKLDTLFSAEKNRAEVFENETIHLSLAILKKLFPLYSQHQGFNELENAIKTILKDHTAPEKIKIELNPESNSALAQKLSQESQELNKNTTIQENENIRLMDAEISWPEGGITYHGTTIAEKIFTLMQEALAERSVNVHDESIGQDPKQTQSLSSTGDKE